MAGGALLQASDVLLLFTYGEAGAWGGYPRKPALYPLGWRWVGASNTKSINDMAVAASATTTTATMATAAPAAPASHVQSLGEGSPSARRHDGLRVPNMCR